VGHTVLAIFKFTIKYKIYILVFPRVCICHIYFLWIP